MPRSRFIAFHAVAETALPPGLAPGFAVVMAHGPAGVVLVFNRHRQVWELPGGLVDPGESAREAAGRELAEESGCIAGELEWLGILEVDDGHRRCGAVFRCTVREVPSDIRNEEVAGIAAWTPHFAPEPLGAADRALLDGLVSTGPPDSA
jgi:8-oxo-dGTP diphosphatase